jgi:hypothetical protein
MLHTMEVRQESELDLELLLVFGTVALVIFLFHYDLFLFTAMIFPRMSALFECILFAVSPSFHRNGIALLDSRRRLQHFPGLVMLRTTLHHHLP